MPPNVPRKRLREEDDKKPSRSRARTAPNSGIPARKNTLFDDLDATATPVASTRANSVLQQLNADDDDDDESSLTTLSDADFEDVPAPKRQKVGVVDDDSDDDTDDDIQFEDVQPHHQPELPDAPVPSGDLELTLIQDTRISLTNPLGNKKGPSKLERKIRMATHCVHVEYLLWHNALRNAWLCDQEVQAMLLSHLPPKLWDEVDRWRRNSGLEVKQEELIPSKKTQKAQPQLRKSKAREKGKRLHGLGPSRDWGEAAEKLEAGAVDMSHGDPLFRLMKALASWWKQRFRTTAPGLRKLGYMSLERLDRFTKGFANDRFNSEHYGERMGSLDDFRRCAQDCSGSRDIGAQLFTALLRALGLEARMVANLQPLGFGWNKLEDANPEKDGKPSSDTSHDQGTAGHANGLKSPSTVKSQSSTLESGRAANPKAKAATGNRTTRQSSARRSARHVVHATDSDQESEEFELLANDSDNDSVVEIPVVAPKKRCKTFDKDLEFAHYWTEVLSPVTRKYLPVDTLVKSVVATNRELIESFEPRGAKADKARQVIAYVVGYHQDGTAKDVTVRYLKRQTLPGKTKGMRIPTEKVPVYNRNGKVKRYDQFDWFKSVMKGYGRGDEKRPITEIDELEDSTDLKPAKAAKKEVKEGEETLQYYKTSQEFVLERHLKREEALLSTAEPVKLFKSKGKGGEVSEENVFLRKDIVNVKSAETWHKQGRAPQAGELPLKRVPYRAATTNRRREIAEAEAATGEKVLQGLYSFEQTDWIIPPPIKDGIIPKNEYGNIDLFAEHMCPEGAIHVPYRGAMRVCKRMQIDYAEAVVDFEFGHRMAVPVIQGVVIAEEHYDRVMEELQKDEAEKARKEDEKRRKAALSMWRKFLMGMRIVARIREDYGEVDENTQVFGHSGRKDRGHGPASPQLQGEDTGGGFLPEGYEDEGEEQPHQKSSFFPVAEEDSDEDDGDALVVEHAGPAQVPVVKDPNPEPQSSSKPRLNTRPKRKAAQKTTSGRRRRRRKISSDSNDSSNDSSGDGDGGDGQLSNLMSD